MISLKRRKYYIAIVALILICISITSYKLYHDDNNKQVTKLEVQEKVTVTVTDTNIDTLNKQVLYEYIKRLKENPKDAKTLHEMGILYSKINDYSIALATIEESLRIDPSNNNTRISLALVNLKEALELKKVGADKGIVDQKLLKAEEISNKIIANVPNMIRAYTLLGDIHTAQGLNGKAIEDYKRALEIDNSIDFIHIAIAKLYLKEGKTGLARRQCEKFLTENNPDNDLINNLLSIIHEQEGNLTKAIQCLKHVLKANRDDLPTHARLSLLYLDSGEYDAAINEAKYILKKKPSAEFIKLAVFLKENALLAKKNDIGNIGPLKQSPNRLSNIKNSYYLFAPLREKEGKDEISTKFFTEDLNRSEINSLRKTGSTKINLASSSMNNSEIALNDINIDSLKEELLNIITKESTTKTLQTRNLQKSEPGSITDFTDKMVELEVVYKDNSKALPSQNDNTLMNIDIDADKNNLGKINHKLTRKDNRKSNTRVSSVECMLNEFFKIPNKMEKCGLNPLCQFGIPIGLIVNIGECYFND